VPALPAAGPSAHRRPRVTSDITRELFMGTEAVKFSVGRRGRLDVAAVYFGTPALKWRGVPSASQQWR